MVRLAWPSAACHEQRVAGCRLPVAGCRLPVQLGTFQRGAARSVAERMICCLAAGPLPAHHRGTRRKYVHVGSYAASMPRKVPRRWAGKGQSRVSVCIVQAMQDVLLIG
ncbi:hypothetical protein XHV734_0364 [Xanthomonas hortorum pv. vitians]|nr:hypothetical protein XHV734_0364 [Xanthomonas hortorum pv. vitians]